MTAFFKNTALTIGLVGGLVIASTTHANTINPPALDNTAFIVMDYDTGAILAQKNADSPLPPASLTKMMTGYIVEQRLLSGQLSEDTPIMMSENAWCGGSNKQSCMFVPVNTTASAIDMLRGIIIQSGNDAARAVAEHISGSESDFAELMNEEATRLGMTKTHFINSTGMPAKGHVSSAKDMANLARAIIRDSGKYYPIYAEKEFTFNNIRQANRNKLLWSDATVDGLKTGHTEEAGFCLVASSKRGEMRLIAVVLGTKSETARAAQAKELLNFGFEHFENIIKAPKGQVATNAPVRFGKQDTVEVATADSLRVLTTKSQRDKISTVVQLDSTVSAPIKEGQVLGQMLAVMDGKTVASVPLVATKSVDEVGFITRMWRGMTSWIGNLF